MNEKSEREKAAKKIDDTFRRILDKAKSRQSKLQNSGAIKIPVQSNSAKVGDKVKLSGFRDPFYNRTCVVTSVHSAGGVDITRLPCKKWYFFVLEILKIVVLFGLLYAMCWKTNAQYYQECFDSHDLKVICDFYKESEHFRHKIDPKIQTITKFRRMIEKYFGLNFDCSTGTYWVCDRSKGNGDLKWVIYDKHKLDTDYNAYNWHFTEFLKIVSNYPVLIKRIQEKPKIVPVQSIRLNWNSSTDAESGIKTYVVYKNGVEVKRTLSTEWVDYNVHSNFEYSVAAVNGVGLVSDASVPVTVKLLTYPGD